MLKSEPACFLGLSGTRFRDVLTAIAVRDTSCYSFVIPLPYLQSNPRRTHKRSVLLWQVRLAMS